MRIVSTSPPAVPPKKGRNWQQSVHDAIRAPAQLLRLLDLPREDWAQTAGSGPSFGLFVPHEFAARMRPGDRRDPLLRQVLPVAEESEFIVGDAFDPLRESEYQTEAGLLVKYPGRALLITTGLCAVHCRYCFRQHFPYADAPKSKAAWEPALERIRADPSIEEIILSGGDPLMLSDDRLAWLVCRIQEASHVQRLRIHTRLPIMIPSRVNQELLQWLGATRLRSIIVLHANHARELDTAVDAAITQLLDARTLVLNQAVLLKGVNDDVDTLCDLSLRLIDAGVYPYYLHQMDRVKGARHFEVSLRKGRALVEAMRDRLPGYAVPKYVYEVPGAASKLAVESVGDQRGFPVAE